MGMRVEFLESSIDPLKFKKSPLTQYRTLFKIQDGMSSESTLSVVKILTKRIVSAFYLMDSIFQLSQMANKPYI